jgi:hypothetical protein
VLTVVTFDAPAPPGLPTDLLSGVFGGIDFGLGQWRWEGPTGPSPSNHVYFDSASGTARTFRFSSAPRVLTRLQVFTSGAGGASGTLTLSDDVGQRATAVVVVGALQLVATNWSLPSTVVTVTFSLGWNLGVDDIAYQ